MIPFGRSLLSRIVVSFFLLSSLMVALLVILGYSFFIHGAEIKTLERMQAVATLKVTAVSRWIQDRRRDAIELSAAYEVKRDAAVLCGTRAGSPEFTGVNGRLRAFFQAHRETHWDVRSILVLALDGGRVVFATDKSVEGQYRVLDSFFIEGKKATFVQNVYPSPITLAPTLTVSTPVKGDDGKLIAVLAVDLDLDAMDQMIQDRTGLGASGEAYIIAKNNVFVSSLRFGGDAYPRGVHSVGIDAAVEGGSGMGMYRNYAGVPVLGVYRWIGERDFALIVELPQEEAFRESRMQTFTLIAVGLFMVASAAAGVYLLARRIAHPILAVKQAAVRVSAGDLSAQAPVLTRDETGELAKSFNSMTVRVKNLYDELKRREEYYRSLIESSTDVIAIIDETMHYTFVSPLVKRVLGYDPEHFIGADPWSFINPDDQALVRDAVLNLKDSEPADLTPIPFRAFHANGETRTMEAIGRNMLSHPAIRGIIFSVRDVTEKVRLEEKLAQAQKMEAVGRLAGGIAHDFNNLLTAMLGYADVLLEAPLDEESRLYTSRIKEQAERAASLTQQLLAYSRKQLLQLRVVDLNALFLEMQDLLKRLIGEDIEMKVSLAPDLKRVRADPSQLEQVIMNLALNARDALPQGGSVIFETANTAVEEGQPLSRELAPGPYVVLSVSDNGIGMDADTRTKIFEPFFTTKGLGKGTGLGLSTVYGIVKQSGGHISVYSEKGSGSTFRIFLPATSEDEQVRIKQPPRGEVPRGSGNILITEDEEGVRRMMELVLSQAGFSVHSEGIPQQAVTYAGTQKSIDLLITDIILPGMNGRKLAEEILKDHPETKVLFISGYTETAIGEHGVFSGSFAFLQKPFLPKTLRAKVDEILHG